MLILRHK